MIVRVIAVGKVKGPLEDAVREFERRAGRYWRLESVEVPAVRFAGDEKKVREGEGARLLAKAKSGAHLVALTRDGPPMDSVTLAGYLESQALASVRDVTFLIGGAYGLDPQVLTRASRRMAISAFTLPHDLARLVLLEQLYRAGTIRRGEPYHKGGGSG